VTSHHPPAHSKTPLARFRGTAVGVLTAALASVGHAAAGGGAPSGAAVVQLALLAVTVGAFAATVRGADRFVVLVAVMTAGQVLAHVLLSATSHHHGGTSATVMVMAHAVALVVVASLVTVGDYLCRAMSRAVRRVTPPPRGTLVAAADVVFRQCDHPLRSTLALASSLSHRGPPVTAAR
jgi:hypothetical protein